MCGDDKKNGPPVPEAGEVRLSYVLFLAILILMLVLCALLMGSAEASGAERGQTAGPGSPVKVIVGRGPFSITVTDDNKVTAAGAANTSVDNASNNAGDIKSAAAPGADRGSLSVEYDDDEKYSVTLGKKRSNGTVGQPVRLKNVKRGVSALDAVNYSQLEGVGTALSNRIARAMLRSVNYDDKDKRDSVTLGDGSVPVKLRNVAGGEVKQGGLEAVNGGQLWKLGESVGKALGGFFSTSNYVDGVAFGGFDINGEKFASVEEALQKIASSPAPAPSSEPKKSEWTLSVNGEETKITDGSRIAIAEGSNINISKDGKSGEYRINVSDAPSFGSLRAGGVRIDGNGIEMGGRRVTGLADGRIVRGGSDAVTGGQLWETYRRIDEIDKRAKMIGAHAAALSALHPVPYDPYAPTTLSAGIGAYRGEYSAAVGAFHYVRENLLVNAGLSLNSGGDLMARAGVSVAVGRGGTRVQPPSADAESMRRELAELKRAVAQLKKENERGKQKIRRLEKLEKTSDARQTTRRDG
ncbi:YadA-like family protein [Cloacibacillus sp. An23]|uniref:YadA-like family protein n=1 Tax=Cloacibacillus sp. An23 TaxID=1965591 RepID=UPI0011783BB2|nr:YadA-like family protein [Cloacibacillus sp. An23]